MRSSSFFAIFWLFFFSLSVTGQSVRKDGPYNQKFSIKYELRTTDAPRLVKVLCDRNGVIQILSTAGLLKPSGGALLHAGVLVPDLSYRPMLDRKITNMALIGDQFVYLDDRAVLSNAWAGKYYARHTLPHASLFAGGSGFTFLLADNNTLQYGNDTAIIWEDHTEDAIIDLLYDKKRNAFWILTANSLAVFSIGDKTIHTKYKSRDLTCFAMSKDNKEIILGTGDGILTIDAEKGTPSTELNRRLPGTAISVIRIIDGATWLGSTTGAFMMREKGGFDYYASARWIPTDKIVDIARGPDSTILLLTDKGLGVLHFQPMTLYDKALFFEQQVRTRHIRNGLNATISRMKDGDPDTGILEDSDNDGLWTSMYLAAEAFRFAVARSPESFRNCRESLDAIERLYTLSPIKGFPARSFERKGYEQADTQVWRRSPNPEWDWKSTTSSDEAIGHIFGLGVIAELIADTAMKNQAIRLIDALMQHIVDHDLYLVDWNGQPTKWGRWNPEYVNARPIMVGDRKITSSNITAMLQTAWHFTHREIYRKKALELLRQNGYLDNLMRPMKSIATAPPTADALSQQLSDGWNHSDDEMYFLGYWGLYRYALNDTLKRKYKAAIIDHWQIERPEKEAAWNIFTAMTDVKDFDLPASIAWLQRYPMDLVNWKVTNSRRRDLSFTTPGFRGQTLTEVLPPDESPINRHNANLFELDGGDGGSSENSAGDIWLLPYWMGRYLGVITGPVDQKEKMRTK